MDDDREQVLKDTQPQTDTLKNRLIRGDKKKFQKYVRSTTTHGVKHIFTGKSKIRRFFWGLLFLGLTIGCLHGIITSIIDYVSVPTATTVHTDHVSQLTFPAVTFCNMNGYNTSYLAENNLTDVVMSAIYQDGTQEDKYKRECASYEASNDFDHISLPNVIAGASQPLEDLVANCRFLGKPCNLSSMFISYPTPTGTCYTFNGRNEAKEYFTVNGAGFRHDLEIVLNVQQDKYIGSPYGEAGVLVSIHQQEVPALVWESGISVPVGHSAYLNVIQRQIEDRSDRPSSDCIHHEETTGLLKLFNTYDYSFRACRGECILDDLVKTCRCLADVFPRSEPADSLYPLCNVSDLCCIFGVIKNTTECHCQVLCNHTTYEVIPSYATYPGLNIMDRVMERYNASSEDIKNSFLKVHVFFKEISIGREITERSYSLTSLIANIGGELGLFLGASIISLTEFFTLIFDQIKDRLFGIREKRISKMLTSYMFDKKSKHNDSLSDGYDQYIDSDYVYEYKNNGKRSRTMYPNDGDSDARVDMTNTL